jgi:hypothetical protein
MITEVNMDLNIRDFDEVLYKKIKAIMAFQGAKTIKEWVEKSLKEVIVDYEKSNGSLSKHLKGNDEKA